MRTLALTILTTCIVLTAGCARAQITTEPCRASAHPQACSNPYDALAAAPKQTKRRSPAHANARSYAPVQAQTRYRAPRYNEFNEPYYGASQGYAPGEKEQFLQSVRRNL